MTVKLPEYISYSQYNSYTRCPRDWYLGRIRRAEEAQAWYIPIGTAVHEMIEAHLKPLDRGDSLSAEDYFYPLVIKQMEIEPDVSKWLAGGPKDAPITHEKALQRVKDCFEKALEYLDDIDVWHVEYDASTRLPGLSVELRGFIDIVGESRKRKRPEIVDWKSGSKKPDNFQLETYGAMLKALDLKAYGKLGGLYAMLAPGTSKAKPIDLSAVDPAEIGAKYQKVREQMEAMQIQAKKNFMCKMCFNAPNCMEYSGPTARSLFYDRSKHDQPPF